MDIVEIANECGAHTEVHYRGTASNVCFSRSQLQQFIQRIEQPLQQRIAELEQELHYTKQAARVEADMCDQARAATKQLRDTLNRAWIGFSCDDFKPGESSFAAC